MEGEHQALVQVNAQTDSQRFEACKRRLDEAGKNLDEALNTLAQWKDHHRDFDPRDPVLRLLEQRVTEADRLLQNANQRLKDMNDILNDSEQRLKDAQKGSNCWIDTGTPFPLSISLLSVLMTNA